METEDPENKLNVLTAELSSDTAASLTDALVDAVRGQPIDAVVEELLEGRFVAAGVAALKTIVGTSGDARLAAATASEVERLVLEELPRVRRRVGRVEAVLARQADQSREILIEELARLLSDGVLEPDELDPEALREAVQRNMEHAARVADERVLRALARLTRLHAGSITRFFRDCGRLLVDLVPDEVDALVALVGQIRFDAPSDTVALHVRKDDARYYWWPDGPDAERRNELPDGFDLVAPTIIDGLLDHHMAARPGIAPQDRLTVLSLSRERAEALAYVVLEDAERKPLRSRPRPPR